MSQYFPGKRFEQNGGSFPIYTLTVNPLAVAGNTLLIAAVTAKKISIVGGSVFSNGAATILSIRDGSAGTVIKYLQVPANTVAQPNIPFLITPDDVIETSAGNGLYIDNSAIAAILSINYIVYTS